MVEQTLSGMRVAVLVADDFEQPEMTEPRKALDQAGARTVLVSPVQGQVHGMNHDKQADVFPVDLPLDQANPDDFDAALLPGGALNADFLRTLPQAQHFVQSLQEQGKPLAIICHAPWLLVSSGLVRGRTLTSYHTIQDDIRNAGGTWRDQPVVRDGNWVTSRQPDDIPAFNKATVELFAAQRQRGALPRAA